MISAVPSPTGAWKKDGAPLNAADYDMETTDDHSALRIPDAQRDDRGVYEVTLTNEAGSEVVPIEVEVLGKTWAELFCVFGVILWMYMCN